MDLKPSLSYAKIDREIGRKVIMDAIIKKAGILVEAIPYIRKFAGKTVVIKYGGAAMVDNSLKEMVTTDISLMKYVGINPVVIHGGGPEISALMERLGKKSQFYEGLRITDDETMELVEMVLVGKINQQIVTLINKQGGKAVGLSGKDGNLIQTRKKNIPGVDLGWVGEVEEINPRIILTLNQEGFIPVVAPVGTDINSNTYNLNADNVAGALAVALKADKLILLTDVAGILRDPKNPHSLISTLTVKEIENLIKDKIINTGMLPKVNACIAALKGGVNKIHIIDGTIPHAILLEIFTDRGIGTEIVK
jgi:acetylglutamate kinase